MRDTIKHSGTVEAVADGVVRVRILQASACGQCAMHGSCPSSEAKVKTVEVRGSALPSVKVGQTVTVTASARTATLALVVAFGVPLVLLVGVLFAALALTGDELRAALAAFAALIPYYIMVWLLRGRIGQGVAFGIETD